MCPFICSIFRISIMVWYSINSNTYYYSPVCLDFMCFEFNEFLLGHRCIFVCLFVCLFTFRRISKKKLLQNQLDSVPYSQNGSNISPIQVSCIRCGKIKQSGKFNCLRCGSTFSVNPSNQKGRKECIELCDTHEGL